VTAPAPARAGATARSHASPRPQPRRHPEGTAQHLQLVEGRRRGFTIGRPRPRAVVAVVAAVLVVFGVVALHAVLAQRQFALDRLSNQVAAEQQRYESLRLQVAELSAPSRIVSTAEGTLGMRAPASVTYLSPSPGAVIRHPTTVPRHSSPTRTIPLGPEGDANWPAIKSLMAGAP
jgi:cell division protein FtsL